VTKITAGMQSVKKILSLSIVLILEQKASIGH